jgi:hypothetical protein
MKVHNISVISVILIFLICLTAVGQHSHGSNYSGQEKRKIKSLSISDIDDLKNGRGWGLAKAAELNGVPGPIHLLEMKDEIGLTEEQKKKIKIIFQTMKSQAIPLGLRLIELEKKLNSHFANHTITEILLKNLLNEIAKVRSKLRFVHLSSHLKTPEILSPQQIRLYNKLRGYSSNDPCLNIPAGHDPQMWKKHNNCSE